MNDTDRISRLNDLAFKRIFGSPASPDVTISFLNSVMGLQGDNAISQLQFADREISPEVLDDKGARLDILVTTGTGEVINIEVQVSNRHDIEKRSLYYWARLHSNQLHAGNPYEVMRKTVTINILAYILYPDSPQLHWTFVPTDAESGRTLGDMEELHFIEVPKFDEKGHQPRTTLEGWLAFLANLEGEAMDSIASKEPAIKKALDIMNHITEDDFERILIIRREMAIHDAISDRLGALAEGRQEGRQEGLSEGRQKGLSDGRREGYQALLRAVMRRFPSMTQGDERLLESAHSLDAEATLSAAMDSRSLDELRVALLAER